MAKSRANKSGRRRVMVVTGTRAEFGLLRTVMNAVKRHTRLELLTCVCGSHFLPPSRTWREVAADFRIDAKVPMQVAGRTGRIEDAVALGRGVAGIAKAIKKSKPDWVVVLGDRIEALAGASAASVAGVAVAHIHGGDRAEGIADEAMRHAITKLAHAHFAATEQSAERIRKMGEDASRVFVTGSPAIDELKGVKPMSDAAAAKFGDPGAVILLHPSGLSPERETIMAETAVALAVAVNPGALTGEAARPLAIMPNHDAGREAIVRVLRHFADRGWISIVEHLPRASFLALLKRLAVGRAGSPAGLIGNSSAGLIEAAALRVPVVNLGPRQAGRERGGNVIDLPNPTDALVDAAATELARMCETGVPSRHAFGDGRTGERIARLLAKIDPRRDGFTRKRNVY